MFWVEIDLRLWNNLLLVTGVVRTIDRHVPTKYGTKIVDGHDSWRTLRFAIPGDFPGTVSSAITAREDGGNPSYVHALKSHVTHPSTKI